jgi:hypothetical protein
MKTHRVWAATGFLLTALASETSQAQNTFFTMENDTHFTVYAVYIWPSDKASTGPDRLGADTIDSGQSYAFQPTNGDCTYNVRVVLDAAPAKRWDDVDLCALTTLSLHYNFMNEELYASSQ